MNNIDISILRLLSKITNIEIDQAINEESISKINWENLFRIASKNKILFLIYKNLINLNLSKHIPKHYAKLIEDSYICNLIRNTNKLNEMNRLNHLMMKNTICFAPVKGGYLIDNIYKDRCIRTTNDIDVLIKRKDISLINEIMLSNGYVQGEYDKSNKSIIIPNRAKKMLYKTTMYNLFPYIKIKNEIPETILMFDFSFALDFSLDTKPVEEMLNSALKKDNGLELLPEHFLIHLCCHHYREASNVAWILIGKDLNLIKFCDVREFILQKMDKGSIQAAIQFAKKHHIEKAIYFTVYFTREIYNDGYETEILEALDIDDESFLYQFGEKGYDELQTRKKDFWTSLFSDNNRDEITAAPKYENLIEGDV